jgi:hypothetical protein
VTGGCKNCIKRSYIYSSPSIVRMIKSRGVRWAGHVARIGAKRNAYGILAGKPERTSHQEEQDVGGWIIIKWIRERYDGLLWTG